MRFSLIVLNWNNAPDTLECLASLEALDHPDFDVIVVDNGSTDGSLQAIRAAYPHHTYLENGANLGFAKGNNQGIELALKQNPDMVMLLNNDTIVHPKMLREIETVAQDHPKAGAFGPKIYFYDEPATIWYSGGGVDKKTGRCYHVGYGASSGYNEVQETEYACGCAIAVRSETLEKVGLMDPRFFLIWEEIDWCKRIRDAGYQCLFVPKAKLWHKVSASFIGGNRGPMWQYHYFRGRLLYHKKHTPHRMRLTKHTLLEGLDLVKPLLSPKTPKTLRAQNWAAIRGIFSHLFS